TAHARGTRAPLHRDRASAGERQSGRSGEGPRHQPESIVGEAAALRSALRSIAEGAVAILLAPECAACHEPLEEPTRGPVCRRCWNAIVQITPACCRNGGDALT